MTLYNSSSVDFFMRSVLDGSFTQDETDNALTALSVLTTQCPALFPSDATFVHPDIQANDSRPSGIIFVHYDDEGVVRSIRVPIEDLSNLRTLVDTLDKLINLDLAA
ncbi:hypothetical protein QEH42_gp284 [Microbacterium phage Pumpernickel]|uniref:Uncharacterized protein n=1 Tax=Microbacterium phage Pumpernickel TaxID=2885983 RepID=A0AAE9C3H4_9CAUD|nr:hypothetical protein QEH42_gp284 [Microbacterium phage Pumpernickel]UDL15934.1 hypothetical protein SEA_PUMPERNICKEL_184 [Microbacterium phage Pumpernickel]